MRGANRTGLILVALLSAACGSSDTKVQKSPASVRALRRAYDGAPPVIPHSDFRMTCTNCHNERGLQLADVGYAPPMPHEMTAGMSAISRCRQCHVFVKTKRVFVKNVFEGLHQDLRKGERLNVLAPPVRPHSAFMRENCSACHTGPAAREEIRCPHPERVRCTQCHVQQTTTAEFSR